jgi:hypothetical protein
MNSHSYDTDLVLWAEDQSRALRDAASLGVNLPIDWQNVAEEIEALGKSQGRELASRIGGILEHLIKLQASPAAAPRFGWRESIQRQRNEIERLLADSPSLRRTVAGVIEAETDKARGLAALSPAGFAERPQVALEGLTYTAEQVLGDWFPDER